MRYATGVLLVASRLGSAPSKLALVCFGAGRGGAGEPTAAGILPEGGEERAGSEAAVQAVSQKHAVLHL